MESNSTYCKRSNYEIIMRGFSADGELASCCKQQMAFSLKDHNLSDLEKLSENLNVSNIRDKKCVICWMREDKEEISWRIHGNELDKNIIQ